MKDSISRSGRSEAWETRHPLFASIRGRLYLLLLSVLIPVLLTQSAYLYERYKTSRAIEFQHNIEMARAMAGTFSGFLKDVLHQELSIGATFTMPHPLSVAEMNQILELNDAEYPAVSRFSWLSPEGRVIASSLNTNIGIDLHDRAYVQKIVSGRDWVVSDLILSRVTGEPVFSVSRGIRGREGNLLGIVVATVSPEDLGGALSVELSKDGTITILDSQGMAVYYHPTREWTWEERNLLKGRPAIRHALEGKEVTGLFPCFVTGEERLVALSPISPIGWAASVGRSKQAAMAPVTSQLLHQVGLFFLIMIAVFFVAITLSERIAGSIRRLLEQAVAIGGGALNRRIKPTGPGELKELASAFNTMAERVEAREEALRESEAKYRELVENAGSIILRIDLEGRVTYFNEFAQKFFGYTKDEILGRSVIGTIMPETDASGRDLSSVVKDALEHPERYERYQGENIRRNGERVWVDWASKALFDPEGNLLGLFSIGTDITERKQAEDALRRSEREKRAILNSLSHVAVIYLDPQMRVLWANPATTNVFDLPPEELKGRLCFEAICGQRAPCPGCPTLKALQTATLQEADVSTPDGSTYLTTSNPIVDPTGKVVNLVHTAINITQRKRMEMALRDLSSRLLSAQEEERKRLAGELHDSIGGSLGAIKCSLENLRDAVHQDTSVSQSLEDLVQMTSRTIDDARRIYMNLRPSILDDLGLIATINWFCRQFQAVYTGVRLEKQIELEEEEIPEDLKIVIFRVMQESFHNISKYSKADVVTLSLTGIDNSLQLTVADSGVGFDPANASSRRSDKGGLGLTSMRERVEISGGAFTIESTPGSGARIRASWPHHSESFAHKGSDVTTAAS